MFICTVPVFGSQKTYDVMNWYGTHCPELASSDTWNYIDTSKFFFFFKVAFVKKKNSVSWALKTFCFASIHFQLTLKHIFYISYTLIFLCQVWGGFTDHFIHLLSVKFLNKLWPKSLYHLLTCTWRLLTMSIPLSLFKYIKRFTHCPVWPVSEKNTLVHADGFISCYYLLKTQQFVINTCSACAGKESKEMW